MQKFMSRFDFKVAGARLIGVERESFLADTDGKIVAAAPQVLEKLASNSEFGYELSACQLEDRVGPTTIKELYGELKKNDLVADNILAGLGLKRLFLEVAPEGMPLDVFPDPTGRYASVASKMSRETLLAACRVVGTHCHVGMPDHNTALMVYNKVIQHTDRLSRLGDKSRGRRLAIYNQVAPDSTPPSYDSWGEFYAEAQAKGFVDDPRRCWHLIRLSVHGTIEFRMFGATADCEEIVRWATDCHELCLQALPS